MKLPLGAVWFVKPFIAPSTRKHYPDEVIRGTATVWGLEARTSPTTVVKSPWDSHRDREPSAYVEIPHNTTIITGETLKDPDALNHPYAEWVEVLFPVRCYVNRVHFNGDSDRVVRVG